MPDVEILPGKATPLPALAAPGGGGAVYLRNKDANFSAWIGDPGVTPGYGDEIPPLGSISWTGQGNPYAIVDDGVTTPITLSVSTTNVDTNDPLALAVATALQLFESGVRVVQSFDKLSDAPGLTSQNYLGPLLDIGVYTSLAVRIQCTANATAGMCAPVVVTWYDADTVYVDTDTFTHVSQFTGQPHTPQTTMRVPIRARYCRVSAILGAGTYDLTVYGGTIATPASLIHNAGGYPIANPSGPYAQPPMLWSSNGTNIAAGGGLAGWIPPVSQSLRMTMDPSGAPAGLIVARLSAINFDIQGAENQEVIASLASINPGGNTQPISAVTVNVPFGTPHALVVSNNDAAARNPAVRVFDVSNN